jgi:hypothetical protein
MKKNYAFCLVFAGVAGGAAAQNVISASDALILPQYAHFGGTSEAHCMPFMSRLRLTGFALRAKSRYSTDRSGHACATTLSGGIIQDQQKD